MLEGFEGDVFVAQDFVWCCFVADQGFGFDYDFFPSFAFYVISEVVCVWF
jgi:hypothetical protein